MASSLCTQLPVPGTAAEDASFISGDEKLKPAAQALLKVPCNQKVPEDSPVKIFRRGTLTCKPGDPCTFVLALPEDVRSED